MQTAESLHSGFESHRSRQISTLQSRIDTFLLTAILLRPTVSRTDADLDDHTILRPDLHRISPRWVASLSRARRPSRAVRSRPFQGKLLLPICRAQSEHQGRSCPNCTGALVIGVISLFHSLTPEKTNKRRKLVLTPVFVTYLGQARCARAKVWGHEDCNASCHFSGSAHFDYMFRNCFRFRTNSRGCACCSSVSGHSGGVRRTDERHDCLTEER